MEGYFLPPLAFTSEEATMLLSGRGLIAMHFDAQYRRAVHACKTIRFLYHTRYTARGPDPYGLLYAGTAWTNSSPRAI